MLACNGCYCWDVESLHGTPAFACIPAVAVPMLLLMSLLLMTSLEFTLLHVVPAVAGVPALLVFMTLLFSLLW
jgi:hypothetical protein